MILLFCHIILKLGWPNLMGRTRNKHLLYCIALLKCKMLLRSQGPLTNFHTVQRINLPATQWLNIHQNINYKNVIDKDILKRASILSNLLNYFLAGNTLAGQLWVRPVLKCTMKYYCM